MKKSLIYIITLIIVALIIWVYFGNNSNIDIPVENKNTAVGYDLEHKSTQYTKGAQGNGVVETIQSSPQSNEIIEELVGTYDFDQKDDTNRKFSKQLVYALNFINSQLLNDNTPIYDEAFGKRLLEKDHALILGRNYGSEIGTLLSTEKVAAAEKIFGSSVYSNDIEHSIRLGTKTGSLFKKMVEQGFSAETTNLNKSLLPSDLFGDGYTLNCSNSICIISSSVYVKLDSVDKNLIESDRISFINKYAGPAYFEFCSYSFVMPNNCYQDFAIPEGENGDMAVISTNIGYSFDTVSYDIDGVVDEKIEYFNNLEELKAVIEFVFKINLDLEKYSKLDHHSIKAFPKLEILDCKLESCLISIKDNYVSYKTIEDGHEIHKFELLVNMKRFCDLTIYPVEYDHMTGVFDLKWVCKVPLDSKLISYSASKEGLDILKGIDQEIEAHFSRI